MAAAGARSPTRALMLRGSHAADSTSSSRTYCVVCRPPPSYRRAVRVTFRKLIEKRVTTWDAVRGKRTHVPGTTMALGRGDVPHDLVQMIVEGALGITDGFWGSIAAGATFNSTGRKRTRPGRAVIAANRDSIRATEHIVGEHHRRWRAGEPTPAARHFDDVASRWADLDDGEGLIVDWPTLRLGREPL